MNNLEAAIKMHIENERNRWIKPENNPIVNHNAELHIKTIEQAPRDSKSIEDLITKKRIEMKAASKITAINNITTELQALKRLYGIVQRYERAESLDGLAY
jgi:hypothetical protein